jgi:TetR/AcrR family transcriptional regulator
MSDVKLNRKQQILEVLATQLETQHGARITTAALAGAVGVSEAALYRHFPSKAKMFDALIEFAESSVFGLITRIIAEQTDVETQCFHIGSVVLKFAERNPGIARILVGDVLLGEHERLRQRVGQFYARLETQINGLLREHGIARRSQKRRAETVALANLIVALISGRLTQYVRTEFKVLPSDYWDEQWQILARSAFAELPD